MLGVLHVDRAGAVQLNHGGQLIITKPSASVSFSEFTTCDSKSYIVVLVRPLIMTTFPPHE